MELSYRRIAHNLNVSVGTAYNTFKLFQDSGDVEAKKRRKRPELCKLDYHHQLCVITLVLDQPNIYLGELCSAVKDIEVSPSTFCKLQPNMVSLEKISTCSSTKEIRLQRGLFATIYLFAKEMLVWVDETGWGVTSVIYYRNIGIHFVEREQCVTSY